MSRAKLTAAFLASALVFVVACGAKKDKPPVTPDTDTAKTDDGGDDGGAKVVTIGDDGTVQVLAGKKMDTAGKFEGAGSAKRAAAVVAVAWLMPAAAPAKAPAKKPPPKK